MKFADFDDISNQEVTFKLLLRYELLYVALKKEEVATATYYHW